MVDNDILVITHPLAPASESHVEALLDILAAITSVTLITANLSPKSDIRDKYDVYEVSNQEVGATTVVAAYRFIRNQIRMCKVIASSDEEIVLFFGATSYLLPIAFSRLIGRTVVLEPRGNVPLTLRLQWEERLPSPVARVLAGSVWMLERIGYWMADAIITYTPSMADELELNRFESKLNPNGARYIDTNQFYSRVPYTERKMVVGFLGRLDKEKNVRMLATAAKELPDEIQFRFIGEGNLRDDLERDLAEKIADGSVEFTGWVDHEDIPQELSQLRLLILPSEATEGLPTVILESMACGTPVLATPVSGVPDVVLNGETGYWIEERSPTHLKEAILKILQTESTASLSDSSRKLICDKYDYEAAVERYAGIIKSLE